MATSPVGKPGDVTGNDTKPYAVSAITCGWRSTSALSALSVSPPRYEDHLGQWHGAVILSAGSDGRIVETEYHNGEPVEVTAGHLQEWRRPTAAFVRHTPDRRWEEWLRVAVAELNEEFPADVTD